MFGISIHFGGLLAKCTLRHMEQHTSLEKVKHPYIYNRHIQIYSTSSDSAVVTISDVFTEAIEHSGIGD
jgi:hypothetical protein